MIVTSVWQAFKKGKELKQAGALKDIANVTSIFVAIISATVAVLKVLGVDLPLTDDLIIILAGGIASLLFVGNAVVAVITSSKVSIVPTIKDKNLGVGD